MKIGDLYCIATLSVQSHGFMLYHGHGSPKQILDIGNDGRIYVDNGDPCEFIHRTDFGQFLPKANSEWRCAYAYDPTQTEEQVVAMLRPLAEAALALLVKAYQNLTRNAEAMVEAVREGTLESGSYYRSFTIQTRGRDD